MKKNILIFAFIAAAVFTNRLTAECLQSQANYNLCYNSVSYVTEGFNTTDVVFKDSIRNSDSERVWDCEPFVAIIRDTLLRKETIDERNIMLDFNEKEMEVIRAMTSYLKMVSAPDTVIAVDTVISGRKLFALIYCGRTMTGFTDKFDANTINLYFPHKYRTSRVFIGTVLFRSNTAGWKFNGRAEED